MKRFTNFILCLNIFFALFPPERIYLDTPLGHLNPNIVLMPVMLLLCLAYMVWRGNKGKGALTIRLKPNTYAVGFFVIWCLYGLISVCWCINRKECVTGNILLLTGATIIISYSLYVNSVEEIVKILKFMLFLCAIHILIGYYETRSGVYMFLDAERAVDYASKALPVSCFINPNDYAMVMLVGFFSAICLFQIAPTAKAKRLLCVLMIAFVAMSLKSGSRAILIGIVLSALGYFLLYGGWRKYLPKLMPFCLIVLAFVPKFRESISKAFGKIFTTDVAVENGSDSIRFNLIKNGLIFLKKYILLGTGSKNIETNMSLYGVYNTNGIVNMHNWWMEILVSSGIFVFVGYLIFYGKLMRDMYRVSKRSKDKTERGIAIAFFGFLVAFIIASISSSSNLGSYIIWTYFAIMIAFEGLAAHAKIACND